MIRFTNATKDTPAHRPPTPSSPSKIRELTGDTVLDVNGARCTWAAFLTAHPFSLAEVREIHDELVRDGETICGNNAIPESEIRLLQKPALS